MATETLDTIITDPGKFEGETVQTRALYESSLDGGLDEEIGSVQDLGWYGLMRAEKCILSEDSQGFVHGQYFDTDAELKAAWSEIEAEYEKFDTEADAEEAFDEVATADDYAELN